MIDRRFLLSSAAAALLTVQTARPASAADADRAEEPPKLKEFKGKANYTFQYPESWAVGFNRGDKAGPLALVGDFTNFDTASVLKADLARLNLPPETAESGDVKALAKALIDEARTTGNTFSFELVNEGTERRDGGRYVIFEYILAICRGEIEEGLEGKRRCLAQDGSTTEPITRHLVAAATFRDGQAYLITASTPAERWQESGAQLRAVAESFQLT